MVGRFELAYFELDLLRPEVLFCTKCDCEGDKTNWCRRVSRNDAIKGGFAWSVQSHVVEAHLRQCACKDQVEPASTVDKYSSEFGSLDDWIEYQWELSWFREAGPLILPGEGDGDLAIFQGSLNCKLD